MLFPRRIPFSNPRKTATAGTAFAIGISPYSRNHLIHVTKVLVKLANDNAITFMRPLNKTTVKSAAAAGQAVINITKDPGLFSTNYAYPLAGGADLYGVAAPNPPTAGFNVADDGILAGDYCMYQCADGTWVLDTVASVATLAITMTTNVPTSTVLANAPFYFFGQAADTNPATGVAHDTFPAVDLGTALYSFDAFGEAFYTVLNPGDPLVIYDPNATVADVVEWIAGYHQKDY